MKSSYPYEFSFLAGISSVFDIGASLQEKHIIPIARGLNFDMQQLSDDQITLRTDYQKAVEKILQEGSGDSHE